MTDTNDIEREIATIGRRVQSLIDSTSGEPGGIIDPRLFSIHASVQELTVLLDMDVDKQGVPVWRTEHVEAAWNAIDLAVDDLKDAS